jgi:protein phosphatase
MQALRCEALSRLRRQMGSVELGHDADNEEHSLMSSAERGFRLRSSARTSVGQVRENNEDSVHLWANEEYAVAVVADGMGGAAAGEEASRMAVEAIEHGIMTEENRDRANSGELPAEFIISKFREVIRSGNTSIIEKAASHPDLRGMGTTVTLAFVQHNQAIVAHVGDSRAYLINGRRGEIRQITHDHSFVEALIAAGHITQEEAEEHPMRHVLYRALGQNEELDIDVYQTSLKANDRLVLCSDGLTRHVRPDEIAELVLLNEDTDLACEALINLANLRGGEDNVSVVVIRVERDPNSPPGHDTDDSTLDLKRVRFEVDDTIQLDADELIIPPSKAKADPDDTLDAQSP